MTVRLMRHWKLLLLWALSLIVVGSISSFAQARRPGGTIPEVRIVTESPTVVSGNDVGFRIERTQDGIPSGKIVVRLNGRWVDTATTASLR
jgi:hypothetical protein